MTTAAVRQRMTHRATIERRTDSTPNAYGHSGPPEWTADDAEVPCFFTLPSGYERVAVERTIGEINAVLLVPLGTDISDRDRVHGISDRAGNVINAGVMNVRDVSREHTHLRVMLQEAS